MLEAKKLMVGDWVIRKGISQEPMQIAGLNTWKGLVYMDFTGLAITEKIENIEPIPLTEEIIKKNDFHFNGLAYIGSVIDLTKSYASPGCWKCGKFYTVGHGDPGFTAFCVIRYVHELQHVLKLCRITKEVIL